MDGGCTGYAVDCLGLDAAEARGATEIEAAIITAVAIVVAGLLIAGAILATA